MTDTQADRATALGMPPDDVETVASADAPFNSHTHELKNIPPSLIRRGDIYKHDGIYLTVSSVISKDRGRGTVLYFRSDDGHVTPPAEISEGVYAVSVHRPKEPMGDSYV